MDANKITITFALKDGHTKAELVETLKVLTFDEGMSYLEELVESIDDGDTIYLNA